MPPWLPTLIPTPLLLTRPTASEPFDGNLILEGDQSGSLLNEGDQSGKVPLEGTP